MEPQRHPHADTSVWRRLWIYQANRFPVFKTATLLGVFTLASISVSAHLGGRSLPGVHILALGWVVSFIFFFQMRACDEWKDLEDDRKFRPERPVPSGLVSLKLIFAIASAGGVLAASLVGLVSPLLLAPLALVWLWLGLMTGEFFAPEWLKARPALYLVSHMAIMPLIDLFLTACEWLPHGSVPPNGLIFFLALSFVNGCVLEVGRKVWAPENELVGVETYSSLLGYRRAAMAWVLACSTACLLVTGVGILVGAALWVGGLSALLLAVIVACARQFIKRPTPKGQKIIDTLSGVWVLVCYCLAGFGPYVAGWIA